MSDDPKDTAAAQVGDDPYKDWIKARKAEIALAKLATIERCAQVARTFKVNLDDARSAQDQLADEILKLGDEP